MKASKRWLKGGFKGLKRDLKGDLRRDLKGDLRRSFKADLRRKELEFFKKACEGASEGTERDLREARLEQRSLRHLDANEQTSGQYATA